METRSSRGRGQGRGVSIPEIIPAEPVIVDGVDLSRISPDRLIQHLREQGHLPEEPPHPLPRPLFEDQTNLEPIQPVDPANATQTLSTDELLRQWLVRQVALTTPTVSAASPTTSTSAIGKSLPKFPDPPLFEGEPGRLDGWVTQTCMYLRAYDIDLSSVRAVEVASMFLRGKAQDWWSSRYRLMESGQAPILGSWHDLVTALTEAFRPVELTRRHIKDLLNLSQGKLDMRSYIATFNAARAKVPGALSDETLSYVFLQGCRQDLQRAIILQNPKTLEEYFSLAVSLADLSSSVPQQQSKKQDKTDKAGGSKAKCSHCGKSNHTVDQCFKLHPELKKDRQSKKT